MVSRVVRGRGNWPPVLHGVGYTTVYGVSRGDAGAGNMLWTMKPTNVRAKEKKTVTNSFPLLGSSGKGTSYILSFACPFTASIYGCAGVYARKYAVIW